MEMCKLDGDCTEEDIERGASLERKELKREQVGGCLCTNSKNPTFNRDLVT